MRRVFGKNGRFRCFGFFVAGIAFFAPIHAFYVLSHDPDEIRASPLVLALLYACVLIALTGLLLSLFNECVVASDSDITSLDLLRRTKFRITYEEVTSYRKHGGRWQLFCGDTRYKLSEIPIEDFHQVMVSKAPKTLNARRFRTGHIPAKDDFDSLWLFDPMRFFKRIRPNLVIGFIFFWISKATTLGYLGGTLLIYFYDLKDLFGYLSVNSTGIVVTWPGHTKKLSWDQVKAVFCDYEGGHRYFVLVGEETSITFPPHIASDLDVMRKVFYSLSEEVLCVNFKEDTLKKGYRRRGKKRRIGDLSGIPDLQAEAV